MICSFGFLYRLFIIDLEYTFGCHIRDMRVNKGFDNRRSIPHLLLFQIPVAGAVVEFYISERIWQTKDL